MFNDFVVSSSSWGGDLYVKSLVRFSKQFNKRFVSTCKLVEVGVPTFILLWCEQITDEAVISLSQVCPGLISVDLEGCSQITDEAVKAGPWISLIEIPT